MLETLLNPKSVAIYGASRTPGKVGYAILANVIQGQFPGPIVPVNPTADEIQGLKCYPDPSAAGIPIDLSVIAVPQPAVQEAVEKSIAAGAKSIIVITAGYKETGPEGAAMETKLAETCKAAGVRLMGPNCVGLISTHSKLNSTFAKHMPMTGGISVLSQSGALCTAMLDWAAGRKIGLAKLISFGNKADLDECDFLEALMEDPDTKVIVAYLESIGHGKQFIKVAEAAAAKKPVVVFKSGTSQAGAKAASSHTGSLAGADIAYGAAFKRAGVIRADTFEELLDYGLAFAMQPLPKGNRIAIVTNAGGPGIMAADAAEHSGMVVGPLAEASAELKEKLPAAASVGNPIDVLGDADPERYAMAVGAAQDDESVDGVICLLTPQAMTAPAETALAIAHSVKGEKPVLAVFMGGEDVLPGREELVANNLPDYFAPEQAVATMKAMCDYSAWRRRPPRIVTRFPVNRRRVDRILSRYIKTGRHQVGEVDAKDILRAYDLTVPDGRVAYSGDEAVEIAQRMGFPIAMKINSPDIIHKSDVGGVRLNLSNQSAVRDAFDLMMLRIQQRMPEAQLDGAYVEQMRAGGREVIIGMTRDPQFGPMLMFGLGGIFVEVMKDVTFHLAPITAEEAMQMLQGTRSYALLRGVRGEAAVDMEAIATSIQRISQLVTDFPQIVELDINPLLVGEVGAGAVAADGRMTLAVDGAKQ